MKKLVCFDENKQPNKQVIDLLSLFQVSPTDYSPKAVREATQAAWYQAGKLRAEIQALCKDEIKKALAMPIFKQLGFVDAVKPKGAKFNYIVFLGAALGGYRKRVKYFADVSSSVEENEEELISLGGERPLLDKENEQALLHPEKSDLIFPIKEGFSFNGNLPTNEAEMMDLVWKQSALPESWYSKKRYLVTTPRIPDETKEDGFRNPNTEETMRTWLSLNPKPGRVLLISSQPFVSFQEWQGTKVLEGFDVEAIGYAAPEFIAVSVFLDNAAKVIFEESLYLESLAS